LHEQWVIPPRENANFVAHMETILDLYQQPYDSDYPLICMDEQPVQLLKDKIASIPAEPGRLERVDYQYERGGTANIFILTEPLGNWRHAGIRERKAGIDWAYIIKELMDEHYPQAKKIRLVCDNYRTHSLGSLYESFPAEEAHRLAKRLEIYYTPTHGSWLNMAEIELSALSRQCLNRHIPDIQTLQREVRTWEVQRNGLQKGVDWRFTTEDARIKLKRLYPIFQM
jgi:hypothetical protein